MKAEGNMKIGKKLFGSFTIRTFVL